MLKDGFKRCCRSKLLVLVMDAVLGMPETPAVPKGGAEARWPTGDVCVAVAGDDTERDDVVDSCGSVFSFRDGDDLGETF